jgi:hypothetical protein
MGWFNRNSDVQGAYDDGHEDGQERRVGAGSRRRPLERDDDQAEAYSYGWHDGSEGRGRDYQ